MGFNGKLPTHGKISTYVKYKCRCAECVEGYKAYRKANRVKNRDSRLEYSKQYYQDNKQYLLEKSKTYIKTDAQREADRIRTRIWNKENKDRKLAYNTAYNKSHPEMRRAINARRRFSHQKMDKVDRFLSAEYRKAIAKDPCRYCGKVKPIMHDDHFFPLALGGTDHWFNLVRSCSDCNLRKSVKCGTRFLLRGSDD